MNVEERLKSMGLTLPAPAKPAGAYAPAVESGGLLFVSGQFPIEGGVPKYVGRVGKELTVEQGRAAARLAALNVLSQINAALGRFDRLKTLLRVEGHVASDPSWNNAPVVLDAASELFAAVLGDRGRHTRTAFTPERLPWDLTVELVVTAAVNAP